MGGNTELIPRSQMMTSSILQSAEFQLQKYSLTFMLLERAQGVDQKLYENHIQKGFV